MACRPKNPSMISHIIRAHVSPKFLINAPRARFLNPTRLFGY
jgi:hypothetical protein